MRPEQTSLEVAIAQEIEAAVAPGWDSLRFEATLMGNVTTCLTYVVRSGEEERSSPPFMVADILDDLKGALARPGQGTWISLTMVLTPEGGSTLEYNYDQEINFGLGATGNDFSLELTLFPRADISVPAWWRDRIVQGDQ